MWKGFESFPVWPTILISVRQLIIATGGEQPAHGYVHEIYLFLLTEFARGTAEFPYPNQKEKGFHCHGFAEALAESGIELSPFCGVVLVHFLGE